MNEWFLYKQKVDMSTTVFFSFSLNSRDNVNDNED